MAPLRVGTLLLGSKIQFLDTSTVDILAMTTAKFLKESELPEAIVALGQDIEFLYISEKGEGLHPLTGDLKVQITHSFESAGQLDYLLVPGPEPSYQASDAEKAFIRAQFTELKALFGICTGSISLARAGVLDGLRATGPRTLLPMLKKLAPKVTWTEKRWETDDYGKVWTSGVVTNGQDSLAAFIRKTFVPELAETVCAIADVGDRGQFYPDQVQA